jgi:hypothetical protein
MDQLEALSLTAPAMFSSCAQQTGFRVTLSCRPNTTTVAAQRTMFCLLHSLLVLSCCRWREAMGHKHGQHGQHIAHLAHLAPAFHSHGTIPHVRWACAERRQYGSQLRRHSLATKRATGRASSCALCSASWFYGWPLGARSPGLLPEDQAFVA